jgi:hypothetical protein
MSSHWLISAGHETIHFNLIQPVPVGPQGWIRVNKVLVSRFRISLKMQSEWFIECPYLVRVTFLTMLLNNRNSHSRCYTVNFKLWWPDSESTWKCSQKLVRLTFPTMWLKDKNSHIKCYRWNVKFLLRYWESPHVKTHENMWKHIDEHDFQLTKETLIHPYPTLYVVICMGNLVPILVVGLYLMSRHWLISAGHERLNFTLIHPYSALWDN